MISVEVLENILQRVWVNLGNAKEFLEDAISNTKDSPAEAKIELAIEAIEALSRDTIILERYLTKEE